MKSNKSKKRKTLVICDSGTISLKTPYGLVQLDSQEAWELGCELLQIKLRHSNATENSFRLLNARSLLTSVGKRELFPIARNGENALLQISSSIKKGQINIASPYTKITNALSRASSKKKVLRHILQIDPSLKREAEEYRSIFNAVEQCAEEVIQGYREILICWAHLHE